MDINVNVNFKPLVPNMYDEYIKVGTNAYNQHYQHLWPHGDTATYIQNSFTRKVLLKEEQDKNTLLYMIGIDTKENYAGIVKLTLNKAIDKYSEMEALYLDKIYLQKEYTGMGIGRKTLEFITERAKELSKKVIYLEAMQKGPALPFYLANGFTIIDTTQVPYVNAIEEERPMYILLKEI